MVEVWGKIIGVVASMVIVVASMVIVVVDDGE